MVAIMIPNESRLERIEGKLDQILKILRGREKAGQAARDIPDTATTALTVGPAGNLKEVDIVDEPPGRWAAEWLEKNDDEPDDGGL